MPEAFSGTPRVDGNALAGLLGDVFAADVTMMIARCVGCGTVAPLAETIVELDDRCAIVMCRGCRHTLMTVLNEGHGASMSIVFGSLGSISFAPTSQRGMDE